MWFSSTVPHPAGTELWIEPYDLMCQGPPWFNLGVDTIPFGSENIDWQTLHDAASAHGLVIEAPLSGSRIIIQADSIHLRETCDGTVQSWCVGDFQKPVVWIDNQPEDRVYFRSMPPDSGQGVTIPMTIGCIGHLYILGSTLYEPESAGLLGVLIRDGNLVIARDLPESWNGIWEIDTDSSMTVSGSFLLVNGKLRAQWFMEPNPGVELTVYGGIQMVEEGYTCAYNPFTGYMGYRMKFEYDNRLFASSPPFYPTFDTGTGVGGGSAPPPPERMMNVLGNPFRETLEVRLERSLETPGELMLLDMAGRLVRRSSITEDKTLQTGNLPPGAYVLVLQSPQGIRETLKVIRL
jgi:hypothetical protein